MSDLAMALIVCTFMVTTCGVKVDITTIQENQGLDFSRVMLPDLSGKTIPEVLHLKEVSNGE